MKLRSILISIITGIILWLSWPTMPFTPLIFIAFTPLLYLTEKVKHRAAYFRLVFLAFLIWNVGSTWWVGNTPVPASGMFANSFNAFLMTIPFMGYKSSRKRLPEIGTYFALIVFWLTFEYIHQTWELSWPWLVLGNAFALHPGWIQWYEFTGASGGTLWVLLSNILVYSAWKRARVYDYSWKEIITKLSWKPLLMIIFPVIISQFIKPVPDNPAEKVGVVIVQPNIDPYDEKFAGGNSMQQVEKLLRLTAQKTDSNTRYIVWPETALFPMGADERELNFTPEIIAIREFLRKFPQAKIISGAVTTKRYSSTDEIPEIARTTSDGIRWDVFNSAIQIDTSTAIQVYHKYELVPGVELIPYVKYMAFMKSVALDMGGISGSYGRTPGVELLTNPAANINVFPTICYESVFSNYVASHCRDNANLLVIITNDGWWGNTEGHRQHMQYARIRAIETRRWIARSANTGISAFVDPAGNIYQPQPYWEEAVIKGDVTSRHDITFYVKNGDLISRGAIIFCILLLVHAIFSRFIPGANVENNQ
ncbi:apolipoprotein N-acyltransferase [Chitinophaga sp. Cy-1792]|uniref:apolipoprotein N-acyltransferase n=1 Tax=Chitinophaga sp. Cy-1792 TaxID=2608339 RepID=UPI00141E4442|nr:apolipoprotein N-acyltransferase [Chitinophaga sp. Cy-1792]NIG53239.1 apolipoprotein N-acyltransferase [Chitinophaga sp. Cy-1792]